MEYLLENRKMHVKFNTLGAEMTSVKCGTGLEYLWQGDPKYWKGQAPVLFPICGTLRNDCAVTKSGKKITMPRHGIVRHREFACERATENTVVFALESDEKMLESFPFAFRLKVKYALRGMNIRVENTIENLGDEVMPYFIGAHPAFNCPLYPGESYDDYYLKFEQAEDISAPYLDMQTGLVQVDRRRRVLDNTDRLDLSHDLFTTDSIVLEGLKSKSVTLHSKTRGSVLQVDFPESDYLLIWSSANGGDFVAIEPWTGLATCTDESDVFEEKRGVRFVEPRGAATYSYALKFF